MLPYESREEVRVAASTASTTGWLGREKQQLLHLYDESSHGGLSGLQHRRISGLTVARATVLATSLLLSSPRNPGHASTVASSRP